MIWEKILGHEREVESFRRCLKRGRLSHAYLFVGPEGIGKKLFARTLAMCLFCERFADTELEACGECPSCRQMLAGTYPDFFSVGRPEGKSEVPIEVFVGPRERRGRAGLCYELSLRPMAGQRKIAVIDDANVMNVESANALLKTLEEPPAGSLLILIATDDNDVLPTIRSRCQSVRFAVLSDRDVSQLLLDLELLDDANQADAVSALCGGSLAVATQLLDPGLAGLRESLYDHLADRLDDPLGIVKSILSGLEEISGDSAAQRKNARWLIRFSVEFFRSAMRELSTGAGRSGIPQVQRLVERLERGSAEHLELLMELIERMAAAEHQLERSTPVPVCFEALFDDLSRTSRSVLIR